MLSKLYNKVRAFDNIFFMNGEGTYGDRVWFYGILFVMLMIVLRTVIMTGSI